jgi:hypothetical protein
VDKRALGEPAESHALEQGDSIATQPRQIGQPPERPFGMFALEGAAGDTPGTRSARLHKSPDDVISDPELRDLGADLSDDPRDLMAQHDRWGNDFVGREQDVSVTEPGRLHIDQDLTPDRRGDVDVSTSRCRGGAVRPW